MSCKLLSFILACCTLPRHAGAYPGPVARGDSSNTVTEATAFAINYGYPLIQYADSLESVLSSTGPNSIFNEAGAATANEAAIVRPNVDTLYSKIPIDLSHVNVALTIPEVPSDRYYVFPFYDFWSNNFVNLGSLHATAPGKYLLRLAGKSSEVGFETCKDDSQYLGIINFPTVYGLVLPRILLLNQSDDDVNAVNAIQAQIKIEQLPRPGRASAPALTMEILGNGSLEPMALLPPDTLNYSSIHMLLEVVGRNYLYTMPLSQSQSQAAQVKQMFNTAGLSRGQYKPPVAVNYTKANQLINASIIAVPRLFESYGNDWIDFIPEASGNFHTHYTVRSLIAQTGYLEMMQSEALYPENIGSGVDGLYLGPNQSYIFTFPSGKPSVRGFWSATAYNSTYYLVQNDLNRYSLGDRSRITYPDGELVYGNTDRNDPFSILIQPADVRPNANWTSNWLPAPAGGGHFTVSLRFYGPNQEMLSGGDYIYPVVTKQSAM